jgi:hypothetical protein
VDKIGAMQRGVGGSGSTPTFRISTDDGGAVSGWCLSAGWAVRIEQADGVVRPASRDEVQAAGYRYHGTVRDITKPNAPCGAHVSRL